MKFLAPWGVKRSKRLMGIIAIICLMAVILAAPGSIWASSSGEGHEAAPKGWEKTDWYRVMNFVVLAGLLILVLRKPAGQALNNRIKNISSELEELEQRKAGVEKQLAEYNNRLATLDKEAEQIVSEYIREEAKERILQAAQASAERLEEQAQKNIDYEFSQAKLALQKDVMEKALVKAEEIIKARISGEDQERLVDEYLNKVEV